MRMSVILMFFKTSDVGISRDAVKLLFPELW